MKRAWLGIVGVLAASSSRADDYAPIVAGVDVTAIAAGAVTAATDVDLMPVAIGVYVWGGPIVHGAHGNFGTAALSFGARLVGPAVGFGVGSLFGTGMPSAGSIIGLLVGAAGAMALDWFVLARSDEPSSQAMRALSFAVRF